MIVENAFLMDCPGFLPAVSSVILIPAEARIARTARQLVGEQARLPRFVDRNAVGIRVLRRGTRNGCDSHQNCNNSGSDRPLSRGRAVAVFLVWLTNRGCDARVLPAVGTQQGS